MSFAFYRSLTIDHTKVPNTDQSNFPVLVSITDNALKSAANGGHVQNASGFDIRPYSDQALTSTLTFELERYNASTGEVVMWVKIPTVSHSSDTVFYLAYGNSALSSDGSSTSTWDSNFQAVYHLKDGSSLNINDSTSNANNQGLPGGSNNPTAGTGQVDGGAAFVAASKQHLKMNLPSGFRTASFSLECWIKCTNVAAGPSLVNPEPRAAAGVGLGMNLELAASKATLLVGDNSGSWKNVQASTTVDSNWHYIAGTFSGTTGTIYLDGTSGGTVTVTAGINWTDHTGASDYPNPAQFFIGASKTNQLGSGATIPDAGFFDGIMDEVRVSSTARSADWIKTCYNNQNAPSTFITVGNESMLSVISADQGLSIVMRMAARYRERRRFVARAPQAPSILTLVHVQRSTIDNWEALAGVNKSKLEPWEAVTSPAQSRTSIYEALTGTAKTSADPFEALAGVSSSRTTIFESLADIVSSRTTIFESLVGLTSSRLEPWESLAGASRVSVDPFEGLAGIVESRTTIFEALVDASSSMGDSYEALAGGSKASADPFEALAGVTSPRSTHWASAGLAARSALSSYESLVTAAIARSENWEGLAGAILSRTSIVEALKGLAPARTTSWESLVLPSQVRTPRYESLVGAASSQSTIFEGLAGAIRQVITPWAATGFAIASRGTSYESIIKLTTSRSSVWESLVGRSNQFLTPWEVVPLFPYGINGYLVLISRSAALALTGPESTVALFLKPTGRLEFIGAEAEISVVGPKSTILTLIDR